MAEMYGEVMELNERLHKDIATKDKSISYHAICQKNLHIIMRAYDNYVIVFIPII